MNIVIKRFTDKWNDLSEELWINDRCQLSVHSLCETPEDATLYRDLVSCTDVVSFMREAYFAGKSGKDLNINIMEEGIK